MFKSTYVPFLLILLLLSSASATEYAYDNLNRLIRVEYDNGSSIEYQYDGSGNRTQKAITAPPCWGGQGGDGDMDGSDLWSYIAGGLFADITVFANSFGRTNCP
jgi:YD repeat-containing protein